MRNKLAAARHLLSGARTILNQPVSRTARFFRRSSNGTCWGPTGQSAWGRGRGIEHPDQLRRNWLERRAFALGRVGVQRRPRAHELSNKRIFQRGCRRESRSQSRIRSHAVFLSLVGTTELDTATISDGKPRTPSGDTLHIAPAAASSAISCGLRPACDKTSSVCSPSRGAPRSKPVKRSRPSVPTETG